LGIFIIMIRDQPIRLFWADIDTNISTIHGLIADTDIFKIFKSCFLLHQFFFKEKVRYLVWTCRDPISLILGTR